MCLAALALGQHPRYPLVLIANRDEFHDRPSVPLAPWSLPSGLTVFSGRDARAGGTWCGMDAHGRVALITNVRRPQHPVPADAPSRGQLPLDRWSSALPASEFWDQLTPAPSAWAPFNLLMGSVNGPWFWGTNMSEPNHRVLPAEGLFGLCNAALDTPWPKLVRLKQHLHRILAHTDAHASLETLCAELWSALADRTRFDDALLPDTGVGLPLERLLSSIFVHDERGLYGTRCATLIVAERHGAVHILERRFSADGACEGETHLHQAGLFN